MRAFASPLSLEGDLHEQLVGLLTRRVFLGPSSQIEIRFSDFTGFVSGYSGGAVHLSKIEIFDSAFPKLGLNSELYTGCTYSELWA